MTVPVLMHVPLVLMLSGPLPDCQAAALPPPEFEECVVAHFDAAVDRYVALHRRAERSLPPERIFEDPEDMFEARRALRSAILAERLNARQGDLFTPVVSMVIIARLDRMIAARRHNPADILEDLDAERLPGIPEPEVNGTFPWDIGSAMWPTLLRALPELPVALEYRFSRRTLE